MEKTEIEKAMATIIESIREKSHGQKINNENIKFVIDNKPKKTKEKLAASDCQIWVCYFVNGQLECGWEPC